MPNFCRWSQHRWVHTRSPRGSELFIAIIVSLQYRHNLVLIAGDSCALDNVPIHCLTTLTCTALLHPHPPPTSPYTASPP
ncbi:hypothetical protein E2C01_097274 [Portunus trituberculatus]|uniref:Uncharacterized protein n=1 Tax=Portunus trituberculatus TaxID=210409 RepID=A0A5B7K5A3_PORTR|nr:hypothetical protein [Portunus trituberculatus]